MIRRNDDGDLVWAWRFEIVVMLTLLAVIGLVVLLGGTAAPAAAQTNNSTLNETAPYYANSTTIGNQTDWLPEDVTLDALGNVSSRLGPYVIGAGEQTPGGTTFSGTIVTGLVMVAVFIGAVGLTNVGMPGGAVVASVAGYGLTELGLAPSWLRIVIIFIVGVVAAVAVNRTTN